MWSQILLFHSDINSLSFCVADTIFGVNIKNPISYFRVEYIPADSHLLYGNCSYTLFQINVNTGTYFYTGNESVFLSLVTTFLFPSIIFHAVLDLNAGGCAEDDDSNC